MRISALLFKKKKERKKEEELFVYELVPYHHLEFKEVRPQRARYSLKASQ